MWLSVHPTTHPRLRFYFVLSSYLKKKKLRCVFFFPLYSGSFRPLALKPLGMSHMYRNVLPNTGYQPRRRTRQPKGCSILSGKDIDSSSASREPYSSAARSIEFGDQSTAPPYSSTQRMFQLVWSRCRFIFPFVATIFERCSICRI